MTKVFPACLTQTVCITDINDVFMEISKGTEIVVHQFDKDEVSSDINGNVNVEPKASFVGEYEGRLFDILRNEFKSIN